MKEKIELGAKEVVETLRKYLAIPSPSIIFDIKKSHDCYIYDILTESEYLDFFTFFGTNPIGFNHPGLRDAGFLDKLTEAALVKPSLARFYTVDLATFIQTFVRVCGKKYFNHYFFIEGGALAVENALKVAFDWKVRKNIKKGLSPDLEVGIVHFEEAFHGRSGYTLTLTNTADPRKYQYYPKFNWPRITNPKCRFPLEGDNLQKTIELEKKAIQEIEKVVKAKGDNIAAIIIEPVQCDGGDNHFRAEFFHFLRKICNSKDLLLIFDEIQTGIGITGKMWAFEHFGIIPDIVCFGKKSQIGGIGVTERIDDVDNVFRVPQRIGSTSGGNLVDMIRGTRTLEIIERENLLENASLMGSLLLEELHKLASEYPRRIENVRGLGLLTAFDLPSSQERDEFVKRCYEKKLLVVITEPRSVRLRPFLDVKQEHIFKMIKIFREVLNEME